MAAYKCKMCGGDLNLVEGENVAECEYCGSRQTVPTADNEKKMTLFGRANRLRLACDFDKAAGIYENIVAEFPEEAEAYWGLVLCKYGIEYVDDPATAKKIPTCHRSSFDSVMEDSDFEQACENADGVARRVYRDEAKAIEELRKGILEVSGKEEPYDIFICYKETDENGERTLDSVLAQDTYDALVDKGYRVFFSRITLEDKLGQEYEPYIFAALNSAKVMLAFGTDYEYYNAVWVKNEWSRYLKLMASDKEKHLIPCYKNIDAYDMPKEFARLQAQDMGKVGAQQDLLRGIEKLLCGKKDAAKESAKENVVIQKNAGPSAESLLERGNLFLDDKNWVSAGEYFDKVLDIDPKCADAYLGKVLAKSKCKKVEELSACILELQDDSDYQKMLRFGGEEFRNTLEAMRQTILKEKKKKKKAARIAREQEKPHLVEVRNRIAPVQGRLSADSHTVGLRSDGTVVAVGDGGGSHHYDDWTDIVAISAGLNQTVGLRSNGTVVVEGPLYNMRSSFIRNSVLTWRNIVAISAGTYHMVGLRSDGTVVAYAAVGHSEDGACDVSEWCDIVAISAGRCYTVGLKSDGTVVAVGDNEYGECGVSEWRDIVAISAGTSHTVGLKSDGTVVAVGDNEYGRCDVSGWKLFMVEDDLAELEKSAILCRQVREKIAPAQGLIAVGDYSMGVKADGTTLFVGGSEDDNKYYERIEHPMDWEGITAISSHSHDQVIVGLRFDGTAVTTDDDYASDVEAWKDLTAVSRGGCFTVGLKADGTAVTTYKDYEEDIEAWKDLTAISAGDRHVVGLRADGTVVAAGENSQKQCEVTGWKNIVAVVAIDEFTVGLCDNGTILTTLNRRLGRTIKSWNNIVAISGYDWDQCVGLHADGTVVHSKPYVQSKVKSWKNVVSVAEGDHHTLGLRADGTVLAANHDNQSAQYGECDVSKWKLFNSLDTLKAEKQRGKAAWAIRVEKQKKQQEQQAAEWRSQGLCQHCGGQMKGFFSKKCSVCGKPKDY